MGLPFWKLSATGNDFVVIDHREPKLVAARLPEFTAAVCARHTGVGADGLLLLEDEDDHAMDFRMRYLNADGSVAAMCGNGGRALAWLARQLGLWESDGHFIADDGAHRIFERDNQLGVSLMVQSEARQISLEGGRSGWYIDTGVPHLVLFTDEIAREDVLRVGARYRFDRRFQPEGTNVNFVQFDGSVLKIRTYERGVEDETLSCGTGILASVIIAEHTSSLRIPANIEVGGGPLRVTRQKEDWILWGSVDEVYTGEIILNGKVQEYLAP